MTEPYPETDGQNSPDVIDAESLLVQASQIVGRAVKTVRTPAQVIAWARAHANTGRWKGQCLGFVRQAFGAPGGVYDAITDWRNAKHKHTSWPPPAGASVYWSSARHGHIALSTGNGKCISTDIKRSGKADEVPITEIHRKWGLKYLGWAEDCSGVRLSFVTERATPKEHVVRMAKINPGQQKSDSVYWVQAALNDVLDGDLVKTGNYDEATEAAAKRFQVLLADPPDGDLGFLQTTELFKRAGIKVEIRNTA